jgi:hypothetical protein
MDIKTKNHTHTDSRRLSCKRARLLCKGGAGKGFLGLLISLSLKKKFFFKKNQKKTGAVETQ